MSFSWSHIVSRVLAVVGGVLLAGVVLRLIVATLSPVLPTPVMADINAGWHMLYGIVQPAMGAVFALLILGAIIYIILGRR